MNPLLRKLLARYMAPAGDDGADTSGADTALADPGDDDNDGDGPEDRGDVVDPSLTEANLRALVDSGGADDGNGRPAASATDPEQVADDAGEDGTQKPQGIPKARFNEVNDRRKALEAENEELRRQLEAAQKAPAPQQEAKAQAAAPAAEATQFDVDAKEQEYAAALIEGDTAKASKIRREINAHLVSEAESRADAKVIARTNEQLLRDEVAATIQAHPWLNEEVGADALDLIVAKRDAEIAKGKAPHIALREAVAKIAPRFAPAEAGATPPKGLAGKEDAEDTRIANANKRGAADSLKQPASMAEAGVGNRASGGQVDVEKLTDEQFEKLSKEEKSRLRGD